MYTTVMIGMNHFKLYMLDVFSYPGTLVSRGEDGA
jgi:hypothetical protein